MRGALRLAMAVVLAVAMMGADGGCKQREKGTVVSDRPDRNEHPINARIAFIRTVGDQQYEVIVHAAEKGKTGGDYTRQKIKHGGEYNQQLTYASGLKIEITVTVKGDPANRYSCEIRDGTKTIAEVGNGLVQCNLTTRR